ncbi:MULTISPECIES: DUF2147 domain-containing protein [unclassified Sphingopyxis]|jgi:uncharacterized protein (DUF2147 family)|uniref:DUF2147 domain-containing protein n=1 Tax=unclassified Sphingopyxis TaxID=2614943 RepID=UPI0024ADA60F|nr:MULTISPECIES: DUF2147 domain-containing protein [unclassified Sphingopyxis]
MKMPALALMLAASTGIAAAAIPQPAANPIGLWENPRGTLLVRTRFCGQLLCGNIVWASPKAMADARDAGVNALIGTELLSDYRKSGAARWTGQVYVPDQGRRFYSTIEQKSPNDIRISGCILGGLLCKRQDWTRQ